MAPIVRLVPNTSPAWVWRSAILASQRAKIVLDRRGSWRLFMWRWRLWRSIVPPPVRLVGRAGEVLGLDLGPFQVWVVERTFWWVG